MSVRAAVLREFEQPLEVRDISGAHSGTGRSGCPGQMAGICGTDVHLWLGQLPIPKPVILGHETVGVIEQLGEGLKRTGAAKRCRSAIASAGRVRLHAANASTAV